LKTPHEDREPTEKPPEHVSDNAVASGTGNPPGTERPAGDPRGPGGAPVEGAAPPPRQQEEDGGETTAGKGGRQGFWRGLLETLVILVIAAFVALLLQSFFFKAFMIPSSSMSQTLQIGDRVMVERVSYYFRKPHRGDIIVFRYPPKEPAAMNTRNLFYWPFEQIGETLHLTHRGTTPYVKRVVATEGETVELRKGKLYVNGKKINEKYIVDDGSDFGPVQVPKGMLFAMGDNRPNSRDSRFWGFVPIRSVIGRAVLRWWPLSRFGSPR